MRQLYGTVAQVLSGDTILLIGVPKGGPPPERQLSLSYIIAPKLALKTKSVENPDQPFAWDAKEFLRKMVVGQPVRYTVEYEVNGREFGTVELEGGKDISLLMVRAGLARLSNLQKNAQQPGHTAPRFTALQEAESKAKETKTGIWTDDEAKRLQGIRKINWIINNVAGTKAFFDEYAHQELPAVVETVRSCGCYRVYFVQQQTYATVLLSGLAGEGFRYSTDASGAQTVDCDPFALEAKYFSSQRVLNRDLHVRIEGSDDVGNLYGTFIHPNGNLTLLLLRNGFGKIHERSLALTKDANQLKEAQREAQNAHLRRWHDFNGMSSNDDSHREYIAQVIEVVSGDCLIVTELDSFGDDAPKERRVYLASIRTPRLGTRVREEEPFAFEAKEFVRKKLIGKRVKVNVCYMRKLNSGSSEPKNLPRPSDSLGRMHFVNISLENGKSDISELLVSKGLANIIPDRGDTNVAMNYDILRQKSEEAVSKAVGMYSTTPPPKSRFNDISGALNANIAKHFQESFKRVKKLQGIIEHMINGSRYKIRIPSESLIISFALAGIRSPTVKRSDAPSCSTELSNIGDEALRYAVMNFLQRPVDISIETCDRGGTFIGVAWCWDTCINVDLTKQGYAQVQGRVASNLQNELNEAQNSAMALGLGIWSLQDVEEHEDALNKLSIQDNDVSLSKIDEDTQHIVPSVNVVHVSNVNDLYVQKNPCSELEELQRKLNNQIASSKTTSKPLAWEALKAGKLVVCQFSEDLQWYRGRIERLYPKTKEAFVRYCDYGNAEMRPLKLIIQCPAEYSPATIPFFAYRSTLTGLKPPIDMEQESIDALQRITHGRLFYCVIEQYNPMNHVHSVQLYRLASDGMDSEDIDQSHSVSINEELLSTGLAMLNKKTRTSIQKQLTLAESKARNARLNVWQHGDIDDDVSD